jgi:hypothetical protein
MNLLRVLDWRAWPDLAIEAPLRFAGRIRAASRAIPQLPADLRDRVTVRWPRVYECPLLATQIREMLSQHVNVVRTELPQPYRRTIWTEFEIDGKLHKVAFCISDYPEELSEQCASQSLVTFKFQFLHDGYSRRNVVPGGHLPRSTVLYDMLAYLRWRKDHAREQFDVYGRFSMDFAPGVRGAALRQLAGTRAFRFQGGDRTVRYSRYLREVARSRVCIDLPGEGPFCCRLIEYLAVGTCVVAVPYPVRLPAPLSDGIHISYCKSGLEDLIPRCQALLDDARQRRAMERAARAFFDRYLHRDRLSVYYLATILAAAGGR